jgi:carbon starvation protein CstA
MDYFTLLKGSFLVIYGIIKCMFCTIELLPENLINLINLEFLSHILKHDKSLAGILLIIIFLIFSIYTLFHGLSELKLAPKNIISFYEYKYRSIFTYFIFGIILITLYSIVLLTNIIPKNKDNESTYKIIGFGCGFLFIASSLFVFVLKRNFDWISLLLLLIILILIGIFLLIVINTIKQKQKDTKNHQLIYEIFSAGLVPFTAF